MPKNENLDEVPFGRFIDYKSAVFGVAEENSIEYENQDEKIRRIIENLTEEKDRELGIP